jgi:hypothetical protein
MKGLGRADRAQKIALVLRNVVRPKISRQRNERTLRAAFLSWCRPCQEVLHSDGFEPRSGPCPWEVQVVVVAPHGMRHPPVSAQLVGSGKR